MARGGYGKSLGWSVGRFEFLDSEQSKVERYWRAIESGSTDWVGQRLVGLWGGNPGTNRRPNRIIEGTLGGMGGRNDQKFVPFFANRGKGELGAARAALYYFFGGGPTRGNPTFENMDLLKVDRSPDVVYGRGDAGVQRRRAQGRLYFWLMTRARVDQMPFVQGIVGQEIKAGYHYARALAHFDPLKVEMDEIRKVFAFALSRNGQAGHYDPATPAGRKQIRTIQAFDSYSKYGEVAPKKGRARKERASHTKLFGAGYLVSMDATANVQDFTRNARGQFTSLQSEVAEVNRRVAAAFQAEVVQLMRQSRGSRPATGDLIRATEDPRNRTPS